MSFLEQLKTVGQRACVKILLPPGGSSVFGQWRRTYSDHFPISFKLKIEDADDYVDFADTT